MYQRLPENTSQVQYSQLLTETITLIRQMIEFDKTNELLECILTQLLDIQKNIVYKQLFISEELIEERYSIGAIAIKNFENDEDLQNRLCDIYGGAIEFPSMPKE